MRLSAKSVSSAALALLLFGGAAQAQVNVTGVPPIGSFPGTIPLSKITPIGAGMLVGNFTGLTAAPQALPYSATFTPLGGTGHQFDIAPLGVTNAMLANPATTVNGQTCTLGSTCTVTAAATSITPGTTTIPSGGIANGLLYDNAGVLGNLATGNNGVLVTGSGGIPSISSTLPSAVQANITGLGTVTSGAISGITGIDNTPIGATTQSTGAFTTLTVNTLTLGSGPQNDTANTVFGYAAGAAFTSGAAGETGVGYNALNATTSGIDNTAVGWQAMLLNAAGMHNTAIGKNALEDNVSGNENVAVGDGALAVATTSGQTAVGQGAMQATTSGADNAAFGWGALYLNQTGSYNTALGYDALAAVVSTNNSTAVGNDALNVATGGGNTAVGQGALVALTTGTGNTAIGAGAGADLVAQTNVTILGPCAASGVASTAVYVCDGAGGLVLSGTTSTLVPAANVSLVADQLIGFTGTAVTTANYALTGDAGFTGLNVPTGGILGFRVNNSSVGTATASGWSFAGTHNLTGIANAAGNEILCYDTTGGPVTYETAVAGCVPSDEHLKNITGTVNPFVAMWRVAWYLPAYYYTFKLEAGLGDDHYVGLLAQDVCAMDAVLCRWDAKGDLNYDKIGLAAYVIAAVKGTAYSIFMLILVVFVGLFAHTKRRHNALHRRLLALESGA